MTGVKKIVLPVDLADPHPLAAEYAGLLARKAGASVVVLYVVPDISLFPRFHAIPDRTEKINKLRDSILDGARRSMDSFIRKHFHGLDVKGEVAIGEIADEILAYAKSELADVIVMGTLGRTGLNAVLFGSVASKVVKRAECPVMTIRPSNEEILALDRPAGL